jgi:hypothetical protein
VGRVIGYEDYDIYLGKQVIKFIDEKDEKIHRKKPGFNEELGIEQLDIVSKKKITNSSNIKLYDDQNNILMENIKWFYETCKKCDNDIVNKIREKIILLILLNLKVVEVIIMILKSYIVMVLMLN